MLVFKSLQLMKLYLIILILVTACNSKPTNPIEQLKAKIEKEIPYHFNYKSIPVDCSKRDSLFLKLYEADQKVRKSGGDMLAVDERNFDLLISYINQCGWPKFNTKHSELKTRNDYNIRTATYLVIQHSFREAMANYYFQFKTSVEKGEMIPNNLAYYKDRLLMHFGLPQVYGSQIRHSSNRIYLYQLWSPDEVNQRRKKMQLYPIEDYLKNYDLDFEQEIRNKN